MALSSEVKNVKSRNSQLVFIRVMVDRDGQGLIFSTFSDAKTTHLGKYCQCDGMLRLSWQTTQVIQLTVGLPCMHTIRTWKNLFSSRYLPGLTFKSKAKWV